MRRTLTAAMFSAALLAPLPARSADDASPVRVAALSGELYRLGIDTKDPLLILAAARLRKQVETTASTLVPEGGSAADVEWLGWEAMVDKAVGMAGDDILLLDLADDLRLSSTKGMAIRPQRATGQVAPGETATYRRVAFTGGEFAEIYIEGSGGSADVDIDLFIRDQAGNLVCSDRDASDRIHCGWLPEATASYDISIVNKGKQVNRYNLITN